MKLHLIQCLIILFFCSCSTMADHKKLRCTWQTQAKCVIWKGKKLCACRPIYLNKTYRDCPPSMKYSCKEVAHGPDCRCYRVS